MMKRLIFLPKDPSYAVSWVVGPVVWVLLSSFDLLGKISDLTSFRATLLAYTSLSILLLTTDGLLLWGYIHPHFLTWDIARRPFCGTFVLVTAIYLSLSGVLLLSRHSAMMTLNPANVDWAFTVKCSDVALVSLAIGLGSSAFWKSDEPGLGNLRLARGNAVTLVRRLAEYTIKAEDAIKAESAITKDEYARLDNTLGDVVTNAEQVRVRLDDIINIRVLTSWEKGAKELRNAVAGVPYEEIKRLDISGPVKQWLAELELSK